MSQAAASERVAVLGVNGVVGRALATRLLESGARVWGMDLDESVFADGTAIDYECCDAAAPTPAALRAIASADTTLLCLPEGVAAAVLPIVLANAPADGLVVDTLSVKQSIVSALEALEPTQEYLSINPLFSPNLPFSGQNVAVVEVRGGPRGDRFQALLQSWGATAVRIGAGEHDRMMALIQVATHAALLAAGLVLDEWGYHAAEGVGMATPPHRICLALLARISSAAPEVYWDIQRGNPYGAEARRSLARQVQHLSEVVDSGDEEGFRQLMGKIAGVVESLRSPLLRCAQTICAASSL